jgi:hypothetical protein
LGADGRSGELEDHDAALRLVLRALARGLVDVVGQLEPRLLELLPTAFLLFPSPDLVDDEGREHGVLWLFGTVTELPN